MTDELKPVRCGCGGEAKHGYHAGFNCVWCEDCGISTRDYDTEAEAIQAWNRAMGAKVINVPNKGKWQRRKGSDCWECSECHAVLESDDIVRHNYYYCYHCGADMMNEDGYMKLEGTEHE